MAYGSGGHTKAHYAATLAATLAFFLHLQGDAVGLLTFDEVVRDYLPPRHRADHLRQLMLALEKPAGGRTTDLAAPLERMAQLARKRGLVVLIRISWRRSTSWSAAYCCWRRADRKRRYFKCWTRRR